MGAAGEDEREGVGLPQATVAGDPFARDRRRIAIECDQPACRTQALEHRPAVATAPERAVDIDAIGTNRKRVDCLGEQDADV